MKRNDFFQLIQPLTDKLYRFAFAIMPDDLQAEQLVIDSFNAYLIKEKKNILRQEIDLTQKKTLPVIRRKHYKGIIQHMMTIGLRRSIQLNEQLKLSRPDDFKAFYDLDPKVRSVLALRFEAQFTVEEIEDMTAMPKYEVIEKNPQRTIPSFESSQCWGNFMIENSYHNYAKKIVPYLDGSMSQEEVSEFEAYVMTHPELETQITTKAEEMNLLKSMIPSQSPTYETHESLEGELKQSVFNLLKEDHRTLINRIQDKWEEFVNR